MTDRSHVEVMLRSGQKEDMELQIPSREWPLEHVDWSREEQFRQGEGGIQPPKSSSPTCLSVTRVVKFSEREVTGRGEERVVGEIVSRDD